MLPKCNKKAPADTQGQNQAVKPVKRQCDYNRKKKNYRFVCWRCGAAGRLVTYHGPGGVLRLCLACAKQGGLL